MTGATNSELFLPVRMRRDSPRRVALVSDWCLPRRGGIETQILGLAKSLQANGVSATIITSFPGPSEIEGVPIERLDCFRLPFVDLAASPRLVSVLRASFARGGYDTIHVHASIVAPLCFAAVPAARSLGLPMVVTFHSVMGTMPSLLSALDRLRGWTDWNVRLSGVSELIAGQIRNAMPRLQVDTLPNGFDYEFWSAHTAPARRSPGSLQLVSTMRLEPRKRPFALVDIVAESIRRASASGADLRLTIAGDGSLRPKLERHIARKGLSGRITLVRWQSPQELRAHYANSSLFVMASRKEAFCIAALEARAAGLPVAAMAGTGITEFIRDGVTGILAKSDDEMANVIAALAADRQLLQQLASENGELWRYDWQRLAIKHIALYEELHRLPKG